MEQENTNRPTYEYATFPRQFISYRWFKPLLVALLAFVFMIIFQIVLLLVAAAWGGGLNFLLTLGLTYDDMDPYNGPSALALLGSVAVLLPSLALAALIVRDRPYSSYSSSRGGWNWGAFFKCLGLGVAIYGILLLVEYLLDPFGVDDIEILFTVEGVIACLILVPLQCVAEEYVFRGFLVQTVASWTKIPAVGIGVAALLFALMHPYNIIGVITIFLNGVVWGIVAWHTKGLEATSAIHIVNNMVAFIFGGLGLEESTSEIDIVSMLVSIGIDIVFLLAVIFIVRKFNWFSSKGDGAAAFNEANRAKYEMKRQRRLAKQGLAQPYDPQQYVPQQAMPQQPYAIPQQGMPQQQYVPQQGLPQQQYASQQAMPQQQYYAPQQQYVPQQGVPQQYAMPQTDASQQQLPPNSGYPEPPVPRQ